MTKRMVSIEVDTPLLPHIVADRVINELERFLNQELPKRGALAEFLAARAETIYLNNDTFRKRIRSASGREYLYCFMRHWLTAEMYNEPGMRQRIPESFGNGQELRTFA